MTEISVPEPEPHDIWKESIELGVDSLIENFELLYEPMEGIPVTPLALDPGSLTDGEDSRLVGELTDKERNFISELAKQKLGVHLASKVVRSYSIQNPDGGNWRGEAQVKVYETAFSNEQAIFLHTIQRPDYPEELFLGGVDYTFQETA